MVTIVVATVDKILVGHTTLHCMDNHWKLKMKMKLSFRVHLEM